MKLWNRMRYPCALLCVILLSSLLFFTLYKYDNKYQPRAHQPAADGVMRLDMNSFEDTSLLHLVQGWEFYQYRFLSPEEIPDHSPDTVLFIGQYAGFELKDKTASPHGDGTYRLTIFTDDTQRDFALELPEIYSAYKIWVNGELKKSEGFADDGAYAAQTSHSMITFTAKNRIEIVIAVRDETHFYSGLVYPPAFGSVEQVLRLLSLRLLLHAGACGIALVAALLSLFFGYRDQKSAFPILGISCISFLLYSGYPLVHMLGLRGEGWYDLERMAPGLLLFSVIWLAGRLCETPRPLYRSMMGIAVAVTLSVPFYRNFVMSGVPDMYAYSTIVTTWRWLAALYLLVSVGTAVLLQKHQTKGLLAGICIIASSIVADRLMPWFEPIVTGWFGEIAAALFILIVVGALCVDALKTYRDNRMLAERASLDALRMESYRQQEEIQQEYLEKTGKLMHDTRRNLITIQDYAASGDLAKTEAFLESLLGKSEPVPFKVTPHRLLNAILSDFLSRAKKSDITVNWRVEVPKRLHLDDKDLVRLLGNILDNALEACLRLENASKRQIKLEILYTSGVLEIVCENSFDGLIRQREDRLLSRKSEAHAHGYGTRIIREITAQLGGIVTTRWDAATFYVTVRLRLKTE